MQSVKRSWNTRRNRPSPAVIGRFTDSVKVVAANAHQHGFDLDMTQLRRDQQAERLREFGIGVWTLPNDILAISDDEVSQLRSFARDIRNGVAYPKNAQFRLQSSGDTYRSMEQSTIPVVSLRHGSDKGMVDIFHADRLFELGRRVREGILSSGAIEATEMAAGQRLIPSNLNFYLNESVSMTRGFHVDSFGERQFKIFLYLTDVESLEFGPYCYAPTSHALEGLEAVNRPCTAALGLPGTDIVLLPQNLPVPIFGRRGTIIASNQSGAHRGYPQAQGAFRAIAALNCRVKA